MAVSSSSQEFSEPYLARPLASLAKFELGPVGSITSQTGGLQRPGTDAIYRCYLARGGAHGAGKDFLVGAIQAVRLPKEFRFQGDEVHIRRHGNTVILEPIAEDWAWLDRIVGKLDEDFVQAVDEHPTEQERPGLEKLFP